MTNTLRAAVYLRQSKDAEDNRLGVDRQREDCLELCAKRGWSVVEYVDNDLSASVSMPGSRRKYKARPGFERLMADVRDGKVDAIVSWDADRLYRHPRELEDIIDMANQKQLALATIGGDFDLGTPTGRGTARMKGVFARMEMEQKSARQKRANKQLRESGRWNPAGSRPYAYDSKTGVPIEFEAKLLKKAATDVLNGKSLRGLCLEWNDSGILTSTGAQWTNLVLRRSLLNPVYAGLVVHEGEVVAQGKWEPLWSVKQHEGLKAFLSQRASRSKVAFIRQHMLSGVAKCGECGGRLYLVRPNPSRSAYSCRTRGSGHVARKAAPLEEHVTLEVLRYLSECDVATGLRESTPEVDTDALRAQRASLKAKKGELATLLRTGILDADDVTRESQIITKDIAAIDAQLDQATKAGPLAALMADADDTEGLPADDDQLLAYVSALADPEHLAQLQEQLAEQDHPLTAEQIVPHISLDNLNLIRRWLAASADIQGKVIDQLFDVTVQKSTPGVRTFDPALVSVVPKK
ncbi:recombinase family protein [Mycobacterium sp. CBMA293]|uniref:recombinase family protein n=1 Tax=unclassified Mycolicibacterium TaxID=2636767 RepID=UPI0012DE43A5|nr:MULTISPECIES: recombinase family protein [unclassified Mycolicibacterium]MUL44497.1 recombinase family protein [Mycolicibacterium sp. CBMA 360]MUL59817.1 recombinase family protein [Mycolicibacterium sp. CBMA 335]MUL68660.1 recombinase family protein [Mycolicibacterium sp. CBMA 311]MUL93949.1 recombinase family protein [Mycolicibacterium sp. CBMA 230]MUM06195.1 hypothetical protein [Mycolicibacterium sp. CBMA 213]